MFFSILKMLPVLVATIVLSTHANAQDFDCSLVNSIDFNIKKYISPDTAIQLSRCYVNMNQEDVTQDPAGLIDLLHLLSYEWELDLLDSMILRVSVLDTSTQEAQLILNEAIGILADRRGDYEKAIKHFRIAHAFYKKESYKVTNLLLISIMNMRRDSSARARSVYREAMETLKQPELLTDAEFYSVFNNSGIILTYLGLEENALVSYRKLIYSPKVSDVDKAKAAFNCISLVSSRRMCDTVKAYSTLMLNNLDYDFVRNDVYCQLMKCASHEDSIALAKEYYSKFKPLDTDASRFLKKSFDFQHLALDGKQEEMASKLPVLWRGVEKSNRKSIAEIFLRGYFMKSHPEVRDVISDYLAESQESEDIRSSEMIDELEVSKNLRLKEAEALQLEAQVQKEKETRKLQYLLAAALMALLGVSLFALISSRRKSKELGIQNDSINTLNRELNHRASNQLGLAYELINDQQRYVTDDAAKALLKRSESQLMALKTVNVFLAKKSDDKLDFDVILKKVCEGLQSASPVPFALKLDLSPATVNANDVVKVALVVNELMNNSIKYAWPQEKGKEPVISIQLERFGNMNRLTYSDNGGGDGGVVLGTGQGASLIQALLADVDASILNPTRSEQGGYVFGFEWDSV